MRKKLKTFEQKIEKNKNGYISQPHIMYFQNHFK